MSQGRSAPDIGYDFGNKRQYRREVWAYFGRSRYRARERSRALLMPSSEGSEIENARRKGFRECDLYVVDRNPAIVAHLKRRYPRINTYGVEVEVAAERIAAAGVDVQFANLDLCGQLSGKLLRILEAVSASRVIKRGLLAVTMLRGREQGFANGIIKAANEANVLAGLEDTSDEARLQTVCGSLQVAADYGSVRYPRAIVTRVRDGRYKSAAGNQTMIWGIYAVHSAPCLCGLCAEEVFLRTDWDADWWVDRNFAVADALGIDRAVLVRESLSTTFALSERPPCLSDQRWIYAEGEPELRRQLRRWRSAVSTTMPPGFAEVWLSTKDTRVENFAIDIERAAAAMALQRMRQNEPSIEVKSALARLFGGGEGAFDYGEFSRVMRQASQATQQGFRRLLDSLKAGGSTTPPGAV